MTELKVKIGDIGRDGYTLTRSVETDFAEMTEKDHLQFIQPFDINARFDRFDNTVVVAVDVHSRFKSECYRSLVKLERDFDCAFSLDYEVEKSTQFIDITEDVRQEIILAIPMRVLSEAELEKDRKGVQTAYSTADDELPGDQEKTYRPFEGLKDID